MDEKGKGKWMAVYLIGVTRLVSPFYPLSIPESCVAASTLPVVKQWNDEHT